MPRFDISSPFRREGQRLSAISKGTRPAVQRAVSSLARRLPVEARRDIQTEYNLPASRISQDLSVRQEEGAVVLIGRARGVGLIAFGGSWRGTRTDGASAQVFKGQAAHVYGGTFVAKGASGNRQIFERRGKSRLPLRALYGPTVAAMLRKGDRESRLGDFAQTFLSTEMNRLLGVV